MRFVEFFQSNEFSSFLEEKNRFKAQLAAVPKFLITNANPALLRKTV